MSGNEVTLIIDGREVKATEGEMLHDAAKRGDVEIPVFCYEPKLGEPVGACRMCLVEVEGIPKLQTSCSTPVRDGMVVHTRTEQVKEAQSAVVEFLLVNHPLDCPVCDKGGECPLQDITMGWGPGQSRVIDEKRHFEKPIELSPLVAIDRERCILCYRCVRFSQEVAEDEQLQLLDRGDRTFVGTFDDRPYIAPFHGNITDLCPVGALTSYTYRFRARPWDIEQAGSVCTLCPSQCNVSFTVRDEQVKRVISRDNAEVDDGWLCDRGRYGFEMFGAEERVAEPRLKGGAAAGWQAAIAGAAAGLKAAGEGRVAAIVGDASNEEGYLVQRIVREALDSPHVDSRVSRGPGREALLRLSRPELSAKVRDIDDAGAVLVLGTDPLHSSPILDLRIRKGMRRNGVRLAVATDRPTPLDGGAEAIARYAPGEATSFLRRLAEALRDDATAAGSSSEHSAPEARSEEVPAAVADALRTADRVVILWGERIAREGDGAIAALLDVADALGLPGKEGAGLLEVPELANARGLREAGCLPDAGPGLTAAAGGMGTEEIRAGLRAGEIKSLVLFGVDPLRDFPDTDAWKSALAAADHIVTFSTFENATTAISDIVFPLETHAEKDGTVTHPDGRLQRVRPSAARPGDIRPNWGALAELALTLGHDTGISSQPSAFAALADAAPIYSGLTDAEIGGRGVRWQDRPAASLRPSPNGDGADGTASAKAQSSGESAPSAPDRSGTFKLGTYRDLWTGPITELNPPLRFLAPQQRVEMAVADVDGLGLTAGDEVQVSQNGTSVRAKVDPKERVQAGTVFLIEGIEGGNANALLNGGPVDVTIEKVGQVIPLADTQFVEATWIMVVKSLVIFAVIFGIVPVMTVVERKLIGRFQHRYGPNRVGPFGLLQPLADLFKLISKQGFRPDNAIPMLYVLGPLLPVISGVMALAIIPFGNVQDGVGLYGIDVPIGILYFFAVGSIAFYGLLLGGWSSGSKYSLLGAMRGAAQLISYEVSMGLALLGVIMMGGSLSLVDIVEAQGSMWFIVPQFVGFLIFMLAGFAETNRTPFDMPEADAELVQGFMTEYGGMRFGSFLMVEYLEIIVVSGVAAAMFLGGWMGPGPGFLDPIWMLLKIFALVFFFIWVRATLPRLRYDQLMSFGWKVLLPLATLNVLVTAVLVVVT